MSTSLYEKIACSPRWSQRYLPQTTPLPSPRSVRKHARDLSRTPARDVPRVTPRHRGETDVGTLRRGLPSVRRVYTCQSATVRSPAPHACVAARHTVLAESLRSPGHRYNVMGAGTFVRRVVLRTATRACFGVLGTAYNVSNRVSRLDTVQTHSPGDIVHRGFDVEASSMQSRTANEFGGELSVIRVSDSH